ncbi:hypothetical protein [Streptomyces sp. TBY4]|uniref:hypothetical protein n=1 Tax=Streptomyces sp. TBY4 TaxID=2962030 RepID=UPI0020B66D1A|nr:hypothetical protein [Streptomyces sp. TBY4]MCP3754000.1 hypothetical protein [Streptomyces sp. TBY4]
MANTRVVTVGAPDDIGLRKVEVDGIAVGKAWSSWEVERMLLKRAHLVFDPDSIHWGGKGSTDWPDKGGWQRRGIGFFMFLGLMATACPLFRIGISDSGDALTYGGRVAGVTILVVSLLEVFAALLCVDYWGKRRWRYSGVVVLAGVVIALLCGIAVLLLQIGERFTGYTVIGIALTIGSSAALAVLIRSRAWKGLRNPKTIAIGAIVSSLLAGANLAYSQIYLPYVKTPLVLSGAEFRESSLEKEGKKDGPLYVTVRMFVKNGGEVPVYILDSKYWIHGVRANNEEDVKGVKGVKDDLVYHGEFVVPVGRALNPGEQVVQDTVVEISDPEGRKKGDPKAPKGDSKGLKYEALRAQTEVYVVRKDRMKIPPEYERSGTPERDLWRVVKDGKIPKNSEYMYQSEISNSSEILNVTRGRQRISVFRVASDDWPRVVVIVSPPADRIEFDPQNPLANEKAKTRYGLSAVRGDTAQTPYAELLEKARSGQKPAADQAKG